ncbi:MAG: endolytic transglycosylase MltG [Candidatus Binatia bacterium]
MVGRRGRRVAAYTLSFAALLALLGGGTAAWVWHDLHAAQPPPPGGVLLSVAPGEPFGTTTTRLQAAGVVRHGWTLRLWARWHGLDRLVRHGEYRFKRPLSPLQVLALLRSPTAALHRVTIPEGSTLRQVASLLAAAGFGGADQFLCLAQDADFLRTLDLPASGLEGYLFPDTYAFTWSTAPDRILSAMVARFREQVGALEGRRRDAGMTEQAMVILASLIEKETGRAEERALVSAVFHNRLRIGMPLQSDPTAVYGRKIDSAPTAADLAIDSPYNTYLHRGLPPGPICNPGRAALKAALSPAPAPYLYFVSRKNGTHAFSRTLAEHNRAVARFQRRRLPGTP